MWSEMAGENMTNLEKAQEHAEAAEALLDVKKERLTGKSRMTVEAASHAAAHASLAVYYASLERSGS
jgi:hypothetical protein